MLAKLMAQLGRFRSDKSGVTAIEYGVIAAAIIVVVIATLWFIGPQLLNTFESVNQNLTAP